MTIHAALTTRQLPPDPEQMNDRRARWAGFALQHYEDLSGAERGNVLSDLLNDLMHLCDRDAEIGSFEAKLDLARKHYASETQDDF